MDISVARSLGAWHTFIFRMLQSCLQLSQLSNGPLLHVDLAHARTC